MDHDILLKSLLELIEKDDVGLLDAEPQSSVSQSPD